MFDWFFRKKEAEKIREEVKNSFDLVKKDINSVGEWIKHFDSDKDFQKKDIEDIKEVLSSIQKDIEEMKTSFSEPENLSFKQVFKTPKKVFKKQTGVYAVQTGVQTGVQTPKLEQFSITERAILWVLLNTDLKLSYEDLAAVLGKEKTTIRGQINAIKQRSEGIIQEITEKNNKKRVFIEENTKEKLLKKVKVRVNTLKKSKKKTEKI